MVQRIGRSRRKTRHLMKKNYRDKGKISLTKYFERFEEGERVKLHAEPAVQKGMYHLRFFGATGKVAGKRGRCYLVEMKDKSKEKMVIVHPVHLQKVK